jgi:allantoin racemase
MRIFAVTPIHVSDDELRRRQQRYQRLAPAGVQIELHDIGPDAPPAMDTSEQIEASEVLLRQALSGTGPGYDGVLPDCVLDPAITALGDSLDVPVFGILRMSMLYAVSTGRRIGALTRNQPIADALIAQVEAYGLSRHLIGVEVMDLDFDAIADDRRWNAAAGSAAAKLTAAGAGWIINGCSAVDVDATPASGRIVDPVATALALIGAGELAA